jgi:adenylate kinase family enzyme
VLDGFPRTVVQAGALDQMMIGRGSLVVVDLVVPEDVLVRRLAARRICGECGIERVGRMDDQLRQVQRRAGAAHR